MQSLSDTIGEADAFRRLHVIVTGKHDSECQHAFGAESRVDIREALGTLKQKAGRDKEDECGTDLSAHEQLAKADQLSRVGLPNRGEQS